jgi:hypothetical protein
MSWWGVNEGRAIPGYDEVDVVGGDTWCLGIPNDATPQFRRNVIGAAVATITGIGIDYALKKYVGPEEQYRLPAVDSPFREGLAEVRDVIVDALNRTMSDRGKQTEPAFVADSALIRLQNSFRGAVILITSHMHFETSALLRLIIEQLAWAWAIHDFEGDYWKVQPQASVGSLKSILPHIGKIYGGLSAAAHVVPANTRHYIRSTTEKTTVYFALPSQSGHDLLILLRLAADYACVCEWLHPDRPRRFRGLRSRKPMKKWPAHFARVHSSLAEWVQYVEANSPAAT